MKPCKKIQFFIVLIIFAVTAAPPVFASGIKDRMLQRLPVINDLKNRGVIGEDNRGYLGYVGASGEQESVVTEENKDRKAVYVHFASQQKTTVDVVESIQGKRKAEKTKPGHFYQSEDGRWIKK